MKRTRSQPGVEYPGGRWRAQGDRHELPARRSRHDHALLLADNNPFGLKVYATLKLAGVPFRHVHVFDARTAPHGQLPYIDDDGAALGDSEAIVAHLAARHGAALDAALTPAQRDTSHLVRRMLDGLYWVMSYARWKDDRYWPQFREAILAAHRDVTEAGLEAARAYNFERYRYQGIGRYAPDEAYARGLADLQVLANLVPERGFAFGAAPTGLDAAIYGFVANIHFYPIDTPLEQLVAARANLVEHCAAIHALVG